MLNKSLLLNAKDSSAPPEPGYVKVTLLKTTAVSTNKEPEYNEKGGVKFEGAEEYRPPEPPEVRGYIKNSWLTIPNFENVDILSMFVSFIIEVELTGRRDRKDPTQIKYERVKFRTEESFRDEGDIGKIIEFKDNPIYYKGVKYSPSLLQANTHESIIQSCGFIIEWLNLPINSHIDIWIKTENPKGFIEK